MYIKNGKYYSESMVKTSAEIVGVSFGNFVLLTGLSVANPDWKELADGGYKLLAIQRLHEADKVGLFDAKDIVETYLAR
jgi:ribosomal protein L7/L12